MGGWPVGSLRGMSDGVLDREVERTCKGREAGDNTSSCIQRKASSSQGILGEWPGMGGAWGAWRGKSGLRWQEERIRMCAVTVSVITRERT